MAHCRRPSKKAFLNKITTPIVLINNCSNRRNELMVGHIRPYRQMQAFIRISINSMHCIQKQYKQKRFQHYRMQLYDTNVNLLTRLCIIVGSKVGLRTDKCYG